MIAAVNRVYATRVLGSAPAGVASLITRAVRIATKIPTPETGLFDEPISPAIYPQTLATASPSAKMNTIDKKISPPV